MNDTKITIKTDQELSAMQEGGALLGSILADLLTMVAVGVTPLTIEKRAQTLIAKAGGTPSFQTVRDYKWATCINVNDGIVHGIPSSRPFQAGDVVTIDVGMLYKGLHTDTAYTMLLADKSDQAETIKFLKIGQQALTAAIAQARVGNRIGHISQTIEKIVEGGGYHVIPVLVGHGVGKTLHEAPSIPGLLRTPIERTLRLEQGMTIAIEIIYAMGTGGIVHERDGWTISTADGSVAAVFEHTILIGAKGPIVLTRRG